MLYVCQLLSISLSFIFSSSENIPMPDDGTNKSIKPRESFKTCDNANKPIEDTDRYKTKDKDTPSDKKNNSCDPKMLYKSH